MWDIPTVRSPFLMYFLLDWGQLHWDEQTRLSPRLGKEGIVWLHRTASSVSWYMCLSAEKELGLLSLEKLFWMLTFLTEALLCHWHLTASAEVVLFWCLWCWEGHFGPSFCCGPGTDKGVASSTCCSHSAKLSPCRERGWLAPQLWCACQQLCTAGPRGLYSTDKGRQMK